MSYLRFLCSLMTLFIFAAFIFVSTISANSNQETASLAIANAEETIILTYEAVLEAEQAGGNVTSLLANLTKAGEFLAIARMLYRNGDFDNAAHLANLSRNNGEEVKNSAYELMDLARNERKQRLWFTMLGSVSGITLVVLGSLRVWQFLKRRYQ